MEPAIVGDGAHMCNSCRKPNLVNPQDAWYMKESLFRIREVSLPCLWFAEKKPTKRICNFAPKATKKCEENKEKTRACSWKKGEEKQASAFQRSNTWQVTLNSVYIMISCQVKLWQSGLVIKNGSKVGTESLSIMANNHPQISTELSERFGPCTPQIKVFFVFTILVKIITRMKLFFLCYVGDYSYSFQGSLNQLSLQLQALVPLASVQLQERIPLWDFEEFSAITVTWSSCFRCNDFEKEW